MKKFLRWLVDQLQFPPTKWLNGDKVGLSGDKLPLNGDNWTASGDKLIPNGDNSKFSPTLTLLISRLL